ncbi:hypothetical protein FPOAC1_001759 [Fusarium poae]|jgi:hypothetical protein|uniref:hypothetical protein n=1 Tax=Fusarium poae TaxID=36050 RepID=UPI001CE8B0ED|nr:hypothetical protein FPOAC1_001759 [Fusarium poae]KAG8675766.1 hypothetical protein FPOAC1_001759 [Fusarium poae]
MEVAVPRITIAPKKAVKRQRRAPQHVEQRLVGMFAIRSTEVVAAQTVICVKLRMDVFRHLDHLIHTDAQAANISAHRH